MSMIKLKALMEDDETFNSIFKKKNKWIEWLKRGDLARLKKELFVLINGAYGPIGGHVGITNVNKILDPKYTWWEAIDGDDDPQADAVMFGKKTRGGIKIGGIGHDGTSGSKSDLMRMKLTQLNKSGYWVEASGRPAEIYYGKGAPYVKDPKIVQKLFPGSKITWLNDKGKYTRTLSGAQKTDVETVFGKPRI